MFNDAMVRFQSRCPTVRKTDTASFGKTSYDFLPLDELVRAITPTLTECGLSFRFDSLLDENHQKVTCTVSHIGGHSEQSSFASPVDGTTAMSQMQKGASAVTYARRYALLLALGIGTADKDDDAVRNDDRPSQEALSSLFKRVKHLSQLDGERLKDWSIKTFGVSSFREMTSEQFDKVTAWANSQQGE